jgi:hypothetical protein
MKELSHFSAAARRDILADAMGTRGDTAGRDTLMKLIQYGNAFLQAERRKPENEARSSGSASRSEILWTSGSLGR